MVTRFPASRPQKDSWTIPSKYQILVSLCALSFVPYRINPEKPSATDLLIRHYSVLSTGPVTVLLTLHWRAHKLLSI